MPEGVDRIHRGLGPSAAADRRREFYNRPMSVFALGLNHTTAPLDLRGRFAFAPQQLPAALQALPLAPATRVERSRRSSPPATAPSSTSARRARALVRPGRRLAGRHRRRAAARRCARTPTCSKAPSAARHAFRVASGLDSMVLGEPQILGQLKQAVREADSAGTLGTTLHQMFQRSFAVAKEVRTLDRDRRALDQHGGGRGAAGVAAVRGPAPRPRVLFVGAGEMIELVGDPLRGAPAAADGRRQPHAASAARSWPRASARDDDARWPTCRRGWPSSTSSSPAPPARCRSSAWARSSAR